MRRLAAVIILVSILGTSGCSLAKIVFDAGGYEHYSDGGSDRASRRQHFEAEHRRWERYERY